MHRRDMVTISVIAVFASASLANKPTAQQKSFKEHLVGTWTLVGCEVITPDGTKAPLVKGDDPKGLYIFTDNGYFSVQAAAKVSPFASNDTMKTTPEEDKSVVQGSIAYFGTYSVNETEKTINEHIERSSFPNLNGTEGKRVVTTLTTDEFEYVNPGRRAGGSIKCAFKRAK